MDISALLTELERAEMEEAAGAVGNADRRGRGGCSGNVASGSSGRRCGRRRRRICERRQAQRSRRRRRRLTRLKVRGALRCPRTTTSQLRPPRPSRPPLVATMAETVPPPLKALPHRRRRRRRSPGRRPKTRAERKVTADRARALGDAPPDEEDLGELALKTRKANKAAKKGKGAAGSAALNTLADTASGAGGSSAGGQGEEEDPRWTPKVKVDKEQGEGRPQEPREPEARFPSLGQILAHRHLAWRRVLQGDLRALGRQGLG